jgi:uncharacterized protein YvpB
VNLLVDEENGGRDMRRKIIFLQYIVVTLLLFGIHVLIIHFFSPIQSSQMKQDSEQETHVYKSAKPEIEDVVIKQQNQNTSAKQDKVLLQNVPFIQQLPELERGCEVTSLAMLLQYAGVSVDKMTLAGEIPTVAFRSGTNHGDPNEGFVGDIYSFSNSGYGVYHIPIFQLANKYLPNQAVDLTGKGIEEVYQMIDAGAPVWIITNSTFAPLDDSEFETWQTNSGTVRITYREHSVVVVGHDEESVYVNDPLADEGYQQVPRDAFEKAWTQMGSQAVSYFPKEKSA